MAIDFARRARIIAASPTRTIAEARWSFAERIDDARLAFRARFGLAETLAAEDRAAWAALEAGAPHPEGVDPFLGPRARRLRELAVDEYRRAVRIARTHRTLDLVGTGADERLRLGRPE